MNAPLIRVQTLTVALRIGCGRFSFWEKKQWELERFTATRAT
jgi:hypothetical protein